MGFYRFSRPPTTPRHRGNIALTTFQCAAYFGAVGNKINRICFRSLGRSASHWPHHKIRFSATAQPHTHSAFGSLASNALKNAPNHEKNVSRFQFLATSSGDRPPSLFLRSFTLLPPWKKGVFECGTMAWGWQFYL